MSSTEPLVDFRSLRWLFECAHDGRDASGVHRFIRGELQGRHRDGRFVLSTQHVDGYDSVAGLLECEAASLPADLELRDHLTVDFEVLEQRTTIDSARLSQLINERLFHSVMPGYPWLRARVLRIDGIDRSYRVRTPEICRAILPLGLEDHGEFWDWRRIEDTTWGSRRVIALPNELSLFVELEGTRGAARVCRLYLNAPQQDWRSGVDRLLEAIRFVGDAAGLPPLDEACVRALHDGTTALSDRYAVLQRATAPEVRIRLVPDHDGTFVWDPPRTGPWAVRAKPADLEPAVAYSPKLALRTGMRIRHATFGEGDVGDVDANVAYVTFSDGTTRKLVHRR